MAGSAGRARAGRTLSCPVRRRRAGRGSGIPRASRPPSGPGCCGTWSTRRDRPPCAGARPPWPPTLAMWAKGSNEYHRMAFSWVIFRASSVVTEYFANSAPAPRAHWATWSRCAGSRPPRRCCRSPISSPQLDADRIADEAGQEVLPEHLAGEPAAEVLQRPGAVHLEGPVDPREEVGDPPGAAFGQGHPQVREVLEHPGPQQVGGGRLDVHRLERDHHVRRRVDGRDGEPARRAEVDGRAPCPCRSTPARPGPSTRRGSSGSPSAAGFSVKLSEWQPLAAVRRTLVRGQLGVPDDRDGHGDEAAGVGAAPLVDVPVVVRADEGERQVGVVARQRPGP